MLQVGTIEPRKDVALVAEACTELSIPFLLAGSGSTGPDAPRSARGLGYVATEDLPALYSAATAVAYSSTTRGSVCRHSKPWRAARQWLRVRSEH